MSEERFKDALIQIDEMNLGLQVKEIIRRAFHPDDPCPQCKGVGEVKKIIGSLGLWPTYDTGALVETIDKVIVDHPKAVKEILAGKMKAYGFLMGRLKQDDKNIDSKEAMTLLKEKIK